MHTFDADTYEAPKESINRFVRLEKGQTRGLIASSVSFTSTARDRADRRYEQRIIRR